jgi:TonB family protein
MNARLIVGAVLCAPAFLGLWSLGGAQNAPTPSTQVAPATAQGDVTGQRAPSPVIKKIRSSAGDPYGEAAKKAGLEGRVSVTFTLAPDGKATPLSIAAYDEPALAYSARDMFGRIEFAPPPAADGSNTYVIGFVFCLKPSGVPFDFPPEAHVPKDTVIVVSGSRLPGAPVKTKKPDGVPDKCK